MSFNLYECVVHSNNYVPQKWTNLDPKRSVLVLLFYSVLSFKVRDLYKIMKAENTIAQSWI